MKERESELNNSMNTVLSRPDTDLHGSAFSCSVQRAVVQWNAFPSSDS